MIARDHDVVVWGATGYTGRLVVEYLAQRYGDGALRWAIAGRNRSKLEAVREAVGMPDLPLLLADGDDRASLDAFAAQTRVVCTTVGPYARYGSHLVAACAEAGTSYCDLAGEIPWIRRMIDAHDARARASGARIVHCCGVDSIPSDVGTYLVEREATKRFGRPLPRVRGRVLGFEGGFSGGTMESMAGMAREVSRDADARSAMADPYGLNPEGRREGPDGADALSPARDPDFGWVAPFLMGSINMRVVRRTNALLDFRYGRDFSYHEGQAAPGLTAALGEAVKTGWTVASAAIPPLHAAARRLGRHAPGDGPSAQEREAGWFRMVMLGDGAGEGERVRVEVSAERDPGYGATAWMLGESAVCLALDADTLPVAGGSWTPAACMGDELLGRLPAAGVRFDMVEA